VRSEDLVTQPHGVYVNSIPDARCYSQLKYTGISSLLRAKYSFKLPTIGHVCFFELAFPAFIILKLSIVHGSVQSKSVFGFQRYNPLVEIYSFLQFSLILLPGLVTGRLFDIGYFKLPLVIASVVLVASTFLIAECKEYWQFLLCQGIATGVCDLLVYDLVFTEQHS
jgi:hypothetical protein